MSRESYWTNSSVLGMDTGSDPITVISEWARSVVFNFLESGGKGPPFNPFEIADYLKLDVRATDDVRDARTIYRDGRLTIEFNPNRPISRVNYSVSHEIAHTFFPDCKDEVRNRSLHTETSGDDWQLEMLCNIGAAELLMPIGSFPALANEDVSIENLLKLRLTFGVSIESLLLRFIKLTKSSCWIFAASRINSEKSLYKIDYAVPSNQTLSRIRSGLILPSDSAVTDCTAIGYTSVNTENWGKSIGTIKVECVGIPAYPGHIFPRVVGIVKSSIRHDIRTSKPLIVKGDATKPRGAGKKLIAFIVNDATPRWGAGFALAIRRRWPVVQENFIRWSQEKENNLTLGNISFSKLDDEVGIVAMISQKGYGQSKQPRLRYSALENCLEELAKVAIRENSTVHMPMIGSGEARGNWLIIYEMIQRFLCQKDVNVIIYELPNNRPPRDQQMSLFTTE